MRSGWSVSHAGASEEPDELVRSALSQLQEYFAGQREEFDLPLDLSGLTATTLTVLRTLTDTVGYWETVTYAELGRLSGTGVPPRAVGSILGAKPVPIIVACHRVLGSDGLGDFSGGVPGRERQTKVWMLELEGALPPALSS